MLWMGLAVSLARTVSIEQGVNMTLLASDCLDFVSVALVSPHDETIRFEGIAKVRHPWPGILAIYFASVLKRFVIKIVHYWIPHTFQL